MKEPFTSVVLAPGIGGAGTVTFTALNIALEQVESIVDCTANTTLYVRGNPAFAQVGYTAATNSVLTLNNSTATLLNSDVLILYYDDLIPIGPDIAIIAAAQGVSGTGIVQPTGGSGILGWLSGIFNLLGTTIATAANQATQITDLGTIITNTGKPANATASDGSTSITAAGTAQNLFSAATPTNGWLVYNPDPYFDLWVSDSTTALVNGSGSILVPPLGIYQTPATYKPFHAVSIVGVNTGQLITARTW